MSESRIPVARPDVYRYIFAYQLTVKIETLLLLALDIGLNGRMSSAGSRYKFGDKR